MGTPAPAMRWMSPRGSPSQLRASRPARREILARPGPGGGPPAEVVEIGVSAEAPVGSSGYTEGQVEKASSASCAAVWCGSAAESSQRSQ